MPPPHKQEEDEGQPTSFLSLPAEIRNYIYELSGCLKVLQCRDCHNTTRADVKETFEDRIDKKADFQYRETTSLWVNRKKAPVKTATWRRRCHLCHWGFSHRENVVGVSQPALTKVSKAIRGETLPMFYGRHTFVITILGSTKEARAIDHEDILAWFDTIGGEKVKMLRKVTIKILPEIGQEDRNLMDRLKDLGVNESCQSVEVVKEVDCESCLLVSEEEASTRLWKCMHT